MRLPPPPPKITGTTVSMEFLKNVVNIKATAEAVTMESAVMVAAMKTATEEAAAKPSVATSAATSKKWKCMLESVINVIKFFGAYMDHCLFGSEAEIVGTGETQLNRTCKLHKEVPFASQLHVGICVCFLRKTWFTWRDGKDEYVLEVFVVQHGIQGCKVGYLPKHLAARANRHDGLCIHIVEIYSGDQAKCDNLSNRQKFHRNIGLLLGGDFGDVRHVYHILSNLI